MTDILNLTQHEASEKQKAERVVPPSVLEDSKNPHYLGIFPEEDGVEEYIQNLLTFEEMPSKEKIKKRAGDLVDLAEYGNFDAVMIGGAPYLMIELVKELERNGITPLFAFTKRKTVEKKEGEKTVKKTIFEHNGFVKMED